MYPITKKCPFCRSERIVCPECGKESRHGEMSRCDNPPCILMDAPMDCAGCGRVASSDLRGVIGQDGTYYCYARF